MTDSPYRILLGVSGSIAAFKAATIVTELVKGGHQVRCVLTEAATHFVTPLTFEALSGYPVAVDIWDEQPGASHIGHLELARWGEALVVAPASADILAKLSLGLADDMLTSVALAFSGPVIVAPAMETRMWRHPATQGHIETLKGRGVRFVVPVSGRLASGSTGVGRMQEPETIVAEVLSTLQRSRDLSGIRALITAGPTYEPIDPVRFIGNRSSGKMGYALAQEAAARGATVQLVAGPTLLPDPPGLQVTHVETTAQMRDAVLDSVSALDVVIMAAAVADFRVEEPALEKMRRSEADVLHLVPTPDIAAEAARAAPDAIHVGFALETHDLIKSARSKLQRKGQDIVVANALSPDHNPFGSESNRVTLVMAESMLELPALPKRDVASRIWDQILRLRAASEE